MTRVLILRVAFGCSSDPPARCEQIQFDDEIGPAA